MTMETLLKDGRIHPARIEELVEKNRQEIDNRIVNMVKLQPTKLGRRTFTLT